MKRVLCVLIFLVMVHLAGVYAGEREYSFLSPRSLGRMEIALIFERVKTRGPFTHVKVLNDRMIFRHEVLGKYYVVSMDALRHASKEIYEEGKRRKKDQIIDNYLTWYFDILGIELRDVNGKGLRLNVNQKDTFLLMRTLLTSQTQKVSLDEGLKKVSDVTLRVELDAQDKVRLQYRSDKPDNFLKAILSGIWRANLAGEEVYGIHFLKMNQNYPKSMTLQVLLKLYEHKDEAGLIDVDFNTLSRKLRQWMGEILNETHERNITELGFRTVALQFKYLKNIKKAFEESVNQKGVQGFVDEYGSLRSMIELGARHGDLNLGDLSGALGNAGVVGELLGLSSENLAFLEKQWKWRIINLPSKVLDDILTEFKKALEGKGIAGLADRYGGLRSMIELGAAHGDLNLGSLSGALGNAGVVGELLGLSSEDAAVLGKQWKWRIIDLPSKVLDDILTEFRQVLEDKGVAGFADRYGGLRSMIELGARHGDLNLGAYREPWGMRVWWESYWV